MDLNPIYAEIGTAALTAGSFTVVLKKYLPKIIRIVSALHHLLDLVDETVEIGEKRQLTADEIVKISKTVDQIRDDFKDFLPPKK